MPVPTRSDLYWHWQHLRILPRHLLIQLAIGLVLAGGSLFAFTKLVSEILEAEMQGIDQQALQIMHAWDPPWMKDFMYFVTKSGSAETIVPLTLVVLAWLWFVRKNVHALLMFAVSSIGGALLNVVLKLALQRPRPLIDAHLDAVGWSLPSGHAMGAMIFYGFIAYLVIRSRRGALTKVLMGIPLVTFVLMIGLSRVYLQAHYFSDVLAGYAAGCFWLVACILVMEFKPWYRKHFVEPEGHLPGDNTIPPEQVLPGLEPPAGDAVPAPAEQNDESQADKPASEA